MIAELHTAFGRKAEAEYYLKRSSSFIFPLLQANPDNADLLRSSAVSYYAISQNNCDQGKYDDAMVSAEKGIELTKSLLKRDEQNFDFSLLYTMLLYSRAKILERSGKAAESLPILQEVIQRAKDLQARDPENEITRVRIAYVDDEIGRVYLAIGLSETNKIARIAALQKARASLQKAYDSYERYGNAMVAMEAEVKDEVAAKITQCDAALKSASAK
jgi:tetratricopeptide (TPR) repeat protein